MLLFNLITNKHVKLYELVDDRNIDLFIILNKKGLLKDKHKLLHHSCRRGHLNFIKWLLNDYNIDLRLDENTSIYECCTNGHLDIAKYLFEIDNNILNFNGIDCVFSKACENKNLDIVQWLYKKISKPKKSSIERYAFQWCCDKNRLVTAQWLYNIWNPISTEILEDAFAISCRHGDIQFAKWILSLDPTIDIAANYNNAFLNSCSEGFIEIAQWLLSLNQSILYNIDRENLFINTCRYGNVETVLWLLDLGIVYHDLGFIECCRFGNIYIAQTLYRLINSSRIHNHITGEALIAACEYGQYDIIKWLLNLPEYTVTYHDINEAFLNSIVGGFLFIARWLYNTYSLININNNNDQPFRSACQYGHQEIAEWLLTLEYINIRALNDAAFLSSCRNKHVNVASWLHRIAEYYYIALDDHGTIKEYHVKNKLEIALDKLASNRIDQASAILGISRKIDTMCLICRDHHDHIVIPPCKHSYCMKCLLTWLLTKRDEYDKTTKCICCKRNFEWKYCAILSLTH